MSVRAVAKPAHMPELDGVRGVAIAMVMALHFVCSQITAPDSWLERVAAKVTGYGNWGVDLFFVLSGFLITGILSDTRGAERYFRAFYARRTLRIFPLYYAVLLVLLVFIPGSLAARYAPALLRTREQQLWLWTYLTNVYIGKVGDFDIPYVSHFWTLAVEEHFYLVWPFVVGGLSRVVVMRICVAASLFALALRLALAFALPETLYAHVLTPCRLDALCIGAWFALANRASGGHAALAATVRGVGLASALGVLATSAWHVVRPADVAPDALRETLLALLFGALIATVSSPDGPHVLKRTLRWGWLGWLGKYSYGLYVYHGIIGYAFTKHGTLPGFVQAAGSHFGGIMLQAVAGTAASIAVAVASYELFEAPFLKLKSRFEPQRAGARVRDVGAAARGAPEAGPPPG